MDYLSDAFLLTEGKRWDVKGKSYFDYPNKYYCGDIGLIDFLPDDTAV